MLWAEDWLSRISVRRVDLPLGDVCDVIDVNNVAYFFVVPKTGPFGVDAARSGGHALVPGVVYVRTTKGSLLRTEFTRLEQLRRRLDPARFLTLSRSVVVNLERIVQHDLHGKVGLAGVLVGQTVEFLPVSRRARKLLRAFVGLPNRIRRAPRATSQL